MGKPKIRFEGYSEDWEQRKLGEICEIKDSARIPNSEWVDSGVPYIRASDIINENLNGMLFISKERYEFYKNRTGAPIKNDVLFNGGGEIGKSLLIMDERPIYVQGGAVLYACTSKANKLKGQYLKTYFETNQARSYIDAVSAGGTIKHFTLKPSQMMPILMPSVAEQEKIGNYFASLDNLITLHQRKCDETKTLKKYMLQKMFPQNGEKVPEIRFDGFTEDWEQRKLGELGTVQTCKRIFKEQTSEQGDIPFFKNGTIGLEPDSYISREVYEEFRRLYPYPEVGDTLISVVGSIGRTAEYTGKDEYFQDSNVVWLKTNGSINKKFLKISYQVIKWLIEGSTVKHLYNDNILRSEIVMPVSQIEQAKIAEFFEELDHLITLHQRKCNELKEIKKYMLQNMFV